jgi:hypothetical protein
MVQYVLIGLTLAVAMVGILWKDPPTPAKVFLILLVLASSAASIYKSREDDQDKKFLQLALTSTLVPSNSDYTRFYKDFDATAAIRGYDVNDYPCHHSSDGLACFFANSDGSKHGTLVLNKADVATLYANQIRGMSNRQTVEALFKKQYTPSINDEEFLDKVGIVGFMTFYNTYHTFPRTYDYDPSFGVHVIWNIEGKERVVQISPDDISRIPPGDGLGVFRKIEELYRQRFKAAE